MQTQAILIRRQEIEAQHHEDVAATRFARYLFPEYLFSAIFGTQMWRLDWNIRKLGDLKVRSDSFEVALKACEDARIQHRYAVVLNASAIATIFD